MADKQVSVTLTANVANYIAAMRQAGAASTQMSAATEANVQKLGQGMTSLGKAMSVGVTLPVVAAGGAAAKMASDFQGAFTRMTSLAGVSASEVEGLQDAVKGLAGETGRAPKELADALYFLRSSGLDADEAMSALEVSAKASAAGMGDTATMADVVSSAMNAYASSGMTAAHATDVLVATARAGKAEPGELANALGRVLPVATELGVTFEDVGGAVASFSQMGNDASGSVTLLSNVLLKLLKPSQQGAAALAAVGLSLADVRASISEVGLLGTLNMLRDRLGDSGFVKFFEDAQAVQGVLALTGENAAGVAATFDQVTNSQGSLTDAFQAWLSGPGAGLSKAWGEVQVAMIEAGEIILPVVADIMGVIADLASAFSELPDPVQTGVLALAGLAAIAGPVLVGAGMIVKSLDLITGAMLRLNAAEAGSGVAGLGAPAGRFARLAQYAKPAAALGAAGYVSWQAGQAAQEQRQNIGNQGNFGDNPAERFANRLVGREMPTGSVAPDLRDAAAAADAATASVHDLGAALGALAGANAGGAALSMQMEQIDRAMSAFGGGLGGGMAASLQEQNEAFEEAVQQLGQMAQAAIEYDTVVGSIDWQEASITAAGTAVGRFNDFMFAGTANVAAQQGAMDGLSSALQEIGTIGVGGLQDFNTATEEGRAGLAALQEVAGAFAPQIEAAVTASAGNVDVLAGKLGELGGSFIQMAVDAGIPRAEAEQLAAAIGLIPANAQTLIELQGDEEAKIRLGLLSSAIGLLQEDVQREVAMRIATGDFQGALDLVQANIAETPDSHNTTLTATDVASAVALGATSTINATPDDHNTTFNATDAASGVAFGVGAAVRSVPTQWTTTFITRKVTQFVTGGAGGAAGMPSSVPQGIANSDVGRYVSGPMLSWLGESGPEVVLPLTDAARMRQLLSDPRVAAPLFAAMSAANVSAGSNTTGGQPGASTVVWNQNAPIYGVNDLKASIGAALRERDAAARARPRARV